MEGTCQTRNTTRVQRVKFGTNRPLGNKRETSTNRARARKLRHSLGTCQGEEPVGTVFLAMIGPNVTSMNATKSAIRSSDMFQTIRGLTTKHITTSSKLRATA